MHVHPVQSRALAELDLLLESPRVCHFDKVRNGVSVIDEHAVFTNMFGIVCTCVRDVHFCVRVHYSVLVVELFIICDNGRVIPESVLEIPRGRADHVTHLPKFSHKFLGVEVDVGGVGGA